MFNTFERLVLRLLLLLIKLAGGGVVERADQGLLNDVQRMAGED